MDASKIHTAVILDETTTFTLQELCQSCGTHAELIIEMIEYGIVEPQGKSLQEWRFAPTALHRIQTTLHLQDDLEVNLAGAALALELLEEIQELRYQLQLLKNM